MPFSAYRSQFPFTASKIYMNHAAVSPFSIDVRERMDWFINNRSFGEIEFYEEIQEIRALTRKQIAKLIGGDSENIAFTSNTSEGLNWLAQGLKWKKGDQIILNDLEFPSNIYPFLNLKKKGVEIVYVKSHNGCIDVADIEAVITPRTRLLSISFVEFLSGYRNDLLEIGALCKKNNIIYSVDGIQGLGVMPIDVKQCHIDFLSSGGHKWLMGPMGVGFMYVGNTLMKELQPVFSGWLSVEDPWDFFNYDQKPAADARRFEYATQNHLGIYGLSAALELLDRAGTAAIEQHLLILGQQFVDRLPEFGLKFTGAADSYYWSGIYTFRGPDCDKIFEYLKQNNVICSLREGCIRFSPHFYNTRDEVMEVIEFIAKFRRENY